MSATINNNTVSCDVQETLPLLLRMVDPEEFAKYDCMTPTALGYLPSYRDAVQEMDWQIDLPEGPPPRYPVVHVVGHPEAEPGANTAGKLPLAYHSFASNVLAYDMNRPAGTAFYHKPRGSWRIKHIYSLDGGGQKIIPEIDDTEVYVKFEVTEPLLLSPFIFGSGHGKQGFYGIQSMNFQMVMNGGKRKPSVAECHLRQQDGNGSFVRGLATSLPVHNATRGRYAGPTPNGPVL